MDPSEIVRTARLGVGLTQAQLAERIGTTQSAISRLESGRILPSLATLERVAKACGSALELHLVDGGATPTEFESDLALTPAGRLDQLVRATRFVQAGRKAMATRRG